MAVFVHPNLGEEVNFLSGYYTFVEEQTAWHQGRRFIFLLGLAEANKACCGHFGGRFIQVVGYPRSEKRAEASGRWVSEVEPIECPHARAQISRYLNRLYPHSQVSFLTFPPS